MTFEKLFTIKSFTLTVILWTHIISELSIIFIIYTDSNLRHTKYIKHTKYYIENKNSVIFGIEKKIISGLHFRTQFQTHSAIGQHYIYYTSDDFNIFYLGPGLDSDSSGFQNIGLELNLFWKPGFSETLLITTDFYNDF